MDLREFQLMNLNDQVDTTWDQGILLGHREEGKQNMILYRIDNFFSEIHYDQDMNEIIGIRSFESDAPLQPYLDKIDLDEFLR
jgi:hypothetical protein